MPTTKRKRIAPTRLSDDKEWSRVMESRQLALKATTRAIVPAESSGGPSRGSLARVHNAHSALGSGLISIEDYQNVVNEFLYPPLGILNAVQRAQESSMTAFTEEEVASVKQDVLSALREAFPSRPNQGGEIKGGEASLKFKTKSRRSGEKKREKKRKRTPKKPPAEAEPQGRDLVGKAISVQYNVEGGRKKYFPGIVEEYNRSTGKYTVSYEDAPCEELLLHGKNSVIWKHRRLSREERNPSKRWKCVGAARKLIGREIEVLWDDPARYFPGTVTEYRNSDGRHKVEYRDETEEWLDLSPTSQIVWNKLKMVSLSRLAESRQVHKKQQGTPSSSSLFSDSEGDAQSDDLLMDNNIRVDWMYQAGNI